MSVHTHSVLVYSMGEVIGDGLIKLPFVAGLRAAFPQARISWCAAKGSTVYTGALSRIVNGLLDEVLVEPPRRGLFDLVVDTQQNGVRAGRARLLGRRFVSGATGWRWRYGPSVWPEPLVGRLAALLERAAPDGPGLQPIRLTEARVLAAAEVLLPAGPRYAGFAPGAGGAEKRWPLASYIALASRTASRGLTPVFFLGPDEVGDADAIRRGVPGVRIPELERTDVYSDVQGPLLVIAMAARLSAAVANDAGPGHMFAAGGAPLLSLQKERRKAVKFRPAAARLELLVAEDYGPAMIALPLDAAWNRLQRLLDL